MRCIATLVVIALSMSLCPAVNAQSSSALINKQLDKLVQLQLNTVLPKAMDQIARDYGVRVEANPIVWELLPWGEQTNISATIANKTLREALDALTGALGLRYVLKEDVIELQPMPALARLGRRATVGELEAIALLSATPMQLQTTRPTLRDLLAAIDAKLIEIDQNRKEPLGLAVENRLDDDVREDQSVNVARNSSVLDALESIAHDTPGTWYPWGKSVVIVSKQDQIQNMLGKVVTLRYNDADVSQVLAELSQRCGVDFTYEAGAIQRIPAQFRSINLTIDSASVKQALEALSAFTGLAYIVNEDGVYIHNPTNPQGAAVRDPVVAMIQLDNGMQLLLPESKVPADLRDYIEHRRERALQNIREMMNEEGFTPVMTPAAPPADEDL
jgi:hypothetical protein